MKVLGDYRIPIKMWVKDIEDEALNQAKNLTELPFTQKWIALMPDSHSGYGMPIGGVMATKDVIVPNAVGVDIGCGMLAVKTSLTEIDMETIKKVIGRTREAIPVGFDHHKDDQPWSGFDGAPDIQIVQQELVSAKKQIGTLGGGNHFIEIQKGDDSFIWLMIHSGSRNFGFKTANVYHKKAQQLCERWFTKLPDKDLAFLPIETVEGKEYFNAMKYCLAFAKANRNLMMERLVEIFHEVTLGGVQSSIDIHHNYAAFEHHFGMNYIIHRKGATKASNGLIGIIPGSMGANSYITEGLGNPDSFESCSHGAGRRMGRNEAKKKLSLADEQKKMIGIVHGLRTVEELDESPGAYKDIDEVMENQRDLTKIVVKLSPLGSIKG